MAPTCGYHLSAKIVSRKAGQSAIAKAAYNNRSELLNEKTGEYTTDYSYKGELAFAGIFAPKDAPEWATDREQLWNKVEAVENRKNSQLAREIEAALPHQLTQQQREFLVKDFVREQFSRKGVIADVAMHPAHEGRDERNEHVHILTTLRKLDGDEFAKHKADHGKESRKEWRKLETAHLENWREKWAEMGARALEKAGYQIEADRWRHGHKELPEQRAEALKRGDLEFAASINRDPTTHRGPTVDAMERRGPETERGNAYRDVASSIVQPRADELAALKSKLAEVEHQIALTQAAGEQWRSSSLETERQFQVAGRDVAQPKPEITAPDEIRDSAIRQIWEAYQRSDNMKSFTAALQENGMMLAGATKEDVRASEIDNQEAKQAGKFSPILREGQIVIVTDKAQVYTLTPRTTGDDWRDIQKFTASLDPKTLESVGAVRETMQHYAEMRDLQRQAFRDITGAPTIKGPSGKSPLAEVDKGLSAGIRTGKKAVETARGDVAAAKTVVQKPASTAEAVLGKFLNSIETMGDALTPEESKAEGKALDAAAAHAEINWKRFAADKDYREFVERREKEQRAKDLERERENERDARQR